MRIAIPCLSKCRISNSEDTSEADMSEKATGECPDLIVQHCPKLYLFPTHSRCFNLKTVVWLFKKKNLKKKNAENLSLLDMEAVLRLNSKSKIKDMYKKNPFTFGSKQ